MPKNRGGKKRSGTSARTEQWLKERRENDNLLLTANFDILAEYIASHPQDDHLSPWSSTTLLEWLTISDASKDANYQKFIRTLKAYRSHALKNGLIKNTTVTPTDRDRASGETGVEVSSHKAHRADNN